MTTKTVEISTMEAQLEDIQEQIELERVHARRLAILYKARDNLVWACDSAEVAGEADPFACQLYDKAMAYYLEATKEVQ